MKFALKYDGLLPNPGIPGLTFLNPDIPGLEMGLGIAIASGDVYIYSSVVHVDDPQIVVTTIGATIGYFYWQPATCCVDNNTSTG